MVPYALLVMQIENALALALPLWKKPNNSFSYPCPRNVLLSWLALCAVFLILNHHTLSPFPRVPEETVNLLEVEECSSSDQERNNYYC